MFTSLFLTLGVLAIVVSRILLTRGVGSGDTSGPVLDNTAEGGRRHDVLLDATR